MKIVRQVLNLHRPGNALALWLALNQPDLFLWVYRRVRRARKRRFLGARFGLGRFAQDTFDVSFDEPDTFDEDSDDTAFDDVSSALDTDAGVLGDETASSPQATLGLEPVTLDSQDALDTLDPGLVTPDTDSGADILDAAGDGQGADGTTIAGCAAASGETTQSALGSVGAALSSGSVLATLAGAAAGAALRGGEAAATVLGTQLALTAAGQTVAPLTTIENPDGTTTAGYVTANDDGTESVAPLSSADVAALAPSSWRLFVAKYGVYVVGGGALAALVLGARRDR